METNQQRGDENDDRDVQPAGGNAWSAAAAPPDDPSDPIAAPAAGESPAARSDGPRLGPALAVYTGLRILLLVVLAGLLSLIDMPLILALLFAIILALPLSWLLFAGPRRRVSEAMNSGVNGRRRLEREKLRSALQGDE